MTQKLLVVMLYYYLVINIHRLLTAVKFLHHVHIN